MGLRGCAEFPEEYWYVIHLTLPSIMLVRYVAYVSIAVPGHEGKLIFSTMGERRVPVVLLVGRAQYVVYLSSVYNQPPPISPHSLILL